MTLKRVLGPQDAAWLVAGNMIGAGIFYTPGLVVGRLPGILGPLAAWTVGGLLALAGAAVYAELGARLPHAGGDYQYLAVAFGPLFGFLTGWAAWTLTFSAAAAAMTIVAVGYLRTAFPFLASVPTVVLAPAFVLVLTWANVVGARVSGQTTAALTALPVLGVFALFGLGLVSGNSAIHWPASPLPAGSLPLAFGAALLPIHFTYSGWNAAAYVAGELKDPARTLAFGLLAGTLGTMLFYVLFNLVILVVVPQARLAGSTTAAADAASLLLGPLAERVLAVIIALAVVGSANVTLMAGSRIYYAMARDGLAPRALAGTNAAGVPAAALWIGGLWSAVLSLAKQVDVLVNWSALAILLLSALAAASLFTLRRRGGETPAFRCPGYPWTPVLFLLVSLAVAWASSVAYPLQALYGALILGAGVPAYYLWRRLARA